MKDTWQGWHLHHLARRAKIFGVEKPLIDALEKSGWYLTRGKQIPPSLSPILEKSLKRLAQIKDFETTCEDIGCAICKRLKQNYLTETPLEESYRIGVELYAWQKQAKKIWWENNGRGIVKVVTGAGKTVFAFSIISELYNLTAYQDGSLKTIIIVPTSALLDQWLVGLMDKLYVPRKDIGIFYGQKKEKLQRKSILLYVVNSARDYIVEHYQSFLLGNDTFLIADECHRYGSRENAKIFQVNYSYTLGLSATPERYGDLGFEEKIAPNLGEIIYTYSYNDALRDGIIPPYKLFTLKVKLRDEEYSQYEEYTDQISKIGRMLFSRYPELEATKPFEFFKKLGSLYERTQDSMIGRYTSLLNLRKGIIHTSRSKLQALKWLISNENLRNERVLIFHERIEIAEKIYEYLKERDFKVGIYHTRLPLEERLENVASYRKGVINMLVSCRALDEGFDVPESNTGIIVAGTSSARQWIQRMGRILRRMPGKEFSRIYVVFVDIVEKDVFKETELKEFEREALSVESISLTFK
ncbi:DEAD/DEAH box helicase [Candidatus Aerophobetes bacterium]|nr:DEAD/DEAH box helicase [Candidatus Aerophobetes bacterium]